jgi:hypothetical protein
MKHLIKHLLLTVLVAFSSAAFAQNAKCEQTIDVKAEQIVITRGVSKVPLWRKKMKKRRFLGCPPIGRSRGASQGCNIIIKNESKDEADIYLQEEYIGSVKPGESALVDKLESYNEISVFSAQDKIVWKAKGDCECKYSFNLKPVNSQAPQEK